MTKFIHCADLHIGKSRDFPSYLDRQSVMCDSIFQLAREKSDGLVVISGDIFDCEVLRPPEKDLFIDKLSQADRDGITTIVLNGNHDIIPNLADSSYTHLRTIKSLVSSKRLKNTYCVEFEPEGLYLDKFKIGIVALPALYRKSKEVNAITSNLTRKLRKNYGESLQVVAAVHETILGSSNETGFAFSGGVKLDADIPVTYWALGDIHAHQQIPGVSNAFYSGCPIQHDFSDSIRRGVLLVDTDKPEEPEFISLQKRVPRLVTVSLKEGQSVSDIDIPTDAIVRVEATKQQLSELYLPDNVVRTKVLTSSVKKQITKPVGLDDSLSGLIEILSEMGLDADGQAFCMDLARKLQ